MTEESGTYIKRPFTRGELLSRLMPQEDVLRFVHISDTHISHDPHYNVPEAKHAPAEGAHALVAAINNLPFTPDFVLHTGDVAYDPESKAYTVARDILSQIRFPVYYLAGNHDDSAELQRAVVGSTDVLAPFDYQFDLRGFQIVCVDSTISTTPPAGHVSVDQLARLEGICAAKDDRPLIIAVHHNVLPIGVPWWDGFMRMSNGEDFHKAILPARDRLRGVFHGHVHQGVDLYRDGILYSSVVSSWYQIHCWPGQAETMGDPDTKPGFNIVSVSRSQTFVRRYHFDVG